MKTTKTMLIVIVLMTSFFSTTISTTQAQNKSSTHRYPYSATGFAKTGIPSTSYLSSGLITAEFGTNPKGLIRQEYLYSMPDRCLTCKTHFTIGRWMTAMYAGVVKHMYPTDNGFPNLFQTTDISEMVGVLSSPNAKTAIIARENYTEEEWERSLWICDEIVRKENPTTWYDTLAAKCTEYKLKDFEGLTFLFINCQPAFVMENAAIILPNNPAKFDYQKFSLVKEDQEWGYKDTVVEKLPISGSAFGSGSDTPFPKPEKPDSKAPEMCPPVIRDPAAEKLMKVEEELTGTKNELSDQKNKFANLEGVLSDTKGKLDETNSKLLEVTGALGQAFDEIIDTREQLAGLNKNIGALNNDIADLKNKAAANEALAEKHLSNMKAQLMEANAKNDKTVGEMIALEEKLGEATELASKAKAETKELAEKVTGLEYGIANQKAVHIAELNKLEQKFKQREDSIVKAQKVIDAAQNLETEKVKARVSKVEERVDKHDKLLDEHGNRLNVLEAENKIQNTRLDANDAKNKSQDENIASNQEEIRKQKIALATVEAGLKSDINALDTKTAGQFKAVDEKVNSVIAKVNEVDTRAQKAEREAAEAKAKAFALEKKMAEDKLAQAQIDREQDTRNAEGINKAQARADQAIAENAALKTKMLEQQAQQKAIAAAANTVYQPKTTTTTTTTVPAGNTTAFDAMYNSKNKKVVRVANIVYEKAPPVIINDTMYVEGANGQVKKYLLNCPKCPLGSVWQIN